ncbi:MAG: hypothetical protein MHM6MM_004013 [Cercozoa sp. M6MM]
MSQFGNAHIERLGEERDPTSATFVIRNEDHTLGNVLRFMLAKNPEVTFTGYSIPHPSEPVLHIRVQTTGCPAEKPLKQAFRDIIKCCDVFDAQYEEAVKAYHKQTKTEMPELPPSSRERREKAEQEAAMADDEEEDTSEASSSSSDEDETSEPASEEAAEEAEEESEEEVSSSSASSSDDDSSEDSD